MYHFIADDDEMRAQVDGLLEQLRDYESGDEHYEDSEDGVDDTSSDQEETHPHIAAIGVPTAALRANQGEETETEFSFQDVNLDYEHTGYAEDVTSLATPADSYLTNSAAFSHDATDGPVEPEQDIVADLGDFDGDELLGDLGDVFFSRIFWLFSCLKTTEN